jgi:hypothetical protein
VTTEVLVYTESASGRDARRGRHRLSLSVSARDPSYGQTL